MTLLPVIDFHAVEIDLAQVQFAKIGIRQVTMGDVHIVPVKFGEFAAGKIGAAEVRALHIRTGPAVFPQFTFLQNDFAEVRVAEVIFGHERAAKPGARGDHIHKAGTAEICAGGFAFADLQTQRLNIFEVGHG